MMGNHKRPDLGAYSSLQDALSKVRTKYGAPSVKRVHKRIANAILESRNDDFIAQYESFLISLERSVVSGSLQLKISQLQSVLMSESPQNDRADTNVYARYVALRDEGRDHKGAVRALGVKKFEVRSWAGAYGCRKRNQSSHEGPRSTPGTFDQYVSQRKSGKSHQRASQLLGIVGKKARSWAGNYKRYHS